MITDMLVGLEVTRLGKVIEAAGLAPALNTVGVPRPARLELVVSGRAAAVLDLSPDHAQAAGVEVATTLLARHDGPAWELRLWAGDEEIGADLLVHEWRSPS